MYPVYECTYCGKPVCNTYFCAECRSRKNDPWVQLLLQHEKAYRAVIDKELYHGFEQSDNDIDELNGRNVFEQDIYDQLAEMNDSPLDRWWSARYSLDRISDWARKGGLTTAETDAWQIGIATYTEAGKLNSKFSAEFLSKKTGKQVTPVAFRKRWQRALEKIRAAWVMPSILDKIAA